MRFRNDKQTTLWSNSNVLVRSLHLSLKHECFLFFQTYLKIKFHVNCSNSKCCVDCKRQRVTKLSEIIRSFHFRVVENNFHSARDNNVFESRCRLWQSWMREFEDEAIWSGVKSIIIILIWQSIIEKTKLSNLKRSLLQKVSVFSQS